MQEELNRGQVQPKTNRIEYIDAMRGFTMLLVVFSHVLLFSFHGEGLHSFNKLFMSFRMPLFFFISGFILYKKNTIWNARQSIGFIWKKFKVQIIATLIFLCFYTLYFGYSLGSSFFSCTKLGYWFTFELFQYYLLYVVVRFVLDRYHKFYSEAILLALVVATQLISVKPWPFVPIDIYNFFSFTFLRYFIYFYFGTIVRRFFTRFVKFSDSSVFMGTGIILYLLVSILYFGYYVFPMSLLLDVLMGLGGIIIVFSFFRRNAASFTQDRVIGKNLQYIGRRTLEIYFLHYFFLPRNLGFMGDFFMENSNPLIEFVVALTISLVVVAVCLVISNVLRLSPILVHILFGAKLPKEVP